MTREFSRKLFSTRATFSISPSSFAVRFDRSPSDQTVDAPMVAAGQRAVVPLDRVRAGPQVSPLTQAQIAWHLAWKPQLLDFSEATLPVIVAEFNRRNPVQIEIPDEALRQRRLSAVIRSDNVTGFIARLEADFGIRAERRPDGGIVLTAR